MGIEMLSMGVAAVVYLGIIGFFVYLILRFIRSMESIADSVKRIADQYEEK